MEVNVTEVGISGSIAAALWAANNIARAVNNRADAPASLVGPARSTAFTIGASGGNGAEIEGDGCAATGPISSNGGGWASGVGVGATSKSGCICGCAGVKVVGAGAGNGICTGATDVLQAAMVGSLE